MTSKRRYVVFAVMLATFLAAVDMTIVDTALPRIVGSLGGFSMFTWLVTAYLLTSTALVPAYGKLADILGRKKVFTLGTVIFLLGSALCGQANDMVQPDPVPWPPGPWGCRNSSGGADHHRGHLQSSRAS
ncbi:MAG: MFS transporter [Candidatus Omnitrophica bacterium]|nr:MFS transporter [Candidatus Omnitrophota bacterium]